MRRELSETEVEKHDLFSWKNKVLGSFKNCALKCDYNLQLFRTSEQENLHTDKLWFYIFCMLIFTGMRFLPLKSAEYAALSTEVVSCLHMLSFCIMLTHSILLSWGLALKVLWLGQGIKHSYALPLGTILFKPVKWSCLSRHHH